MDSFTANVLLNTITKGNLDEVADIYKQLSSGGGNPPSEEQIAWFLEHKGDYVKVVGTSHIGIIKHLNKATHGFYEGGRYPIYVRIVASDMVRAIGDTFEYTIGQLTLIEEEDMKKHSFNETEVLLLERCIGKTSKDAMWKLFTESVKDFGGSVKVTGSNFLTHEVIGLDEEYFNFVLEFIRD